MTYKYYKFNDESDAPTSWPSGVSVSVVGRIIEQKPIYDDGGVVIQPPTYKPGWHINICYSGNIDLSRLQQYEIQVGSPRRIWFGQST